MINDNRDLRRGADRRVFIWEERCYFGRTEYAVHAS